MADDLIPEKTAKKKRQQRQANQLDRRNVSDQSRKEIEDAIDSITDDATRQALMEVAHILTGDDRFEPDDQ